MDMDMLRELRGLPRPPLVLHTRDSRIDMNLATAHQINPEVVSCLNRCNTFDAKLLCIRDVAKKLRHAGDYDIGGTYNMRPEFWFLFKTTPCQNKCYLLNLHVQVRNPGNFSIGVSDGKQLHHLKESVDHTSQAQYSEELMWQSFRCPAKEQIYYIKTFNFTYADLKAINDHTLYIPIRIKTDVTNTMNEDIINRIKVTHNIGGHLYRANTKDFKIELDSGKVFDVHKIVLAAHSPVLRELVKDESATSAKIPDLSDEDMQLLLEFLYMGGINNIINVDYGRLLNLSSRFMLRNMYVLTQHNISKQINIDNVVNIALMAEKYQLDKLQMDVITFIIQNPKVLESEGWKNMGNVEIAKKIVQYMCCKSYV